MDMEYLLLLQNLREATNNVLSPFLMWVSDFATGFWPIAMLCMIFWAFDRKAGRKLLAGFGLGVLCNGFLKLSFRIPRPWIRDDRILPYGDSITTATGYSFPSGTATFATSLFGGTGLWLRRKNRVLSCVCFLVLLLTMFSRNYLGVHTPQDVLVGFAATSVMMFCAAKIEDWTEKDGKRDIVVLILGVLLCVGLHFFYRSIDIEAVYDATGTLVVNPAKMLADSYEGIGSILALVICRFFEKRYFHFDSEKPWKDRFIIGVFALIPLYFWCNNIFDVIAPYSRALARFVFHSGIMVYTLILVPLAMEKIHISK